MSCSKAQEQSFTCLHPRAPNKGSAEKIMGEEELTQSVIPTFLLKVVLKGDRQMEAAAWKMPTPLK